MRRVHKIFFILIFAWPFSARSQQKEHELNHVLPLPVGSMRIDSFSHWLARESGFVFSFNAEMINPGKEIKFPGKKESLNELLFYLHAHYGINHRFIGNHIILYVDNPAHKKTVVSILKKEKQIKALPEGKFRPTAPTILPDAGHRISYMPNSFMLSPKIIKVINEPGYIPQNRAIEADSDTQEKAIRQQDQQNTNEKQNRKDNTWFNGNNDLYISAGFTESEVLYVNPQIRAGLPWLFTSVEWRTNFKASGFFYGIGTSINLPGGNWGIQLSASNGTLSKIYKTPNSDTLIRIKSRLSQVNLSVEKDFGNRWMLEFGPVLNFMKSNYTSTVATIPNSPIPMGPDLDKTYYILHPPYTFSSSYNEKTGIEKKLWIGLQVGLFYRLR